MSRRRTRGTWENLHGQVFISYAYDDDASKELLLELLPRHVEPILYARQDPDPEHAVSDGIVPAILSAEALIYLEGGQSDDSVWVNFERDYALRAKKPVYAFDPSTGALRKCTDAPVALRVQVMLSEGDEAPAEALLRWMKEERFFEFEVEASHVRMGDIPIIVADLIRLEQVAVWLMGRQIGAVASLAYEIPSDMLAETYDDPAHGEADFEDFGRWLADHSMYVRLTPDWEPIRDDDPDVSEFIISEFAIEQQFASGWAVDLVPGTGGGEIDWNRADDLIVRLTLMVQQSWPFLEDDDEDDDEEDEDD